MRKQDLANLILFDFDTFLSLHVQEKALIIFLSNSLLSGFFFSYLIFIFYLFQQEGDSCFQKAWMHLTLEYQIMFEGERLRPPIVADLNGDCKREVLVATHDAEIQVLYLSMLLLFFSLFMRFGGIPICI